MKHCYAYAVALLCISPIFAEERSPKLSHYSSEDLYMLGKNKRMEGDYKKALPYFRAALAQDPQHRKAHIELATSYLACENYVRGFDLLDSYVSSSIPTDKLWRGQNLENKRILVYTSQWGIGDDIMFSRYLRCLKEMGAHVGLVVPNDLQKLFSFNIHVDSIQIENLTVNIEADEIYFSNNIALLRREISGYDYYTHLMSLPKLCKIRKSDIPSEFYFSVNAQLYDKYAAVCRHDKNLKVGLCWRGAERHDKQLQQRSINFEYLKPLLQCKDITFYCLQQGDALKELCDAPEASIMRIFDDFDQESGSFMDTAALMRNLDLVITVDTSIAHLAGALGIKTWVMIPYAADWRYAAHSTTCPWYPTMRVFKQKTAGDWNSVVKDVIKELGTFVS